MGGEITEGLFSGEFVRGFDDSKYFRENKK